MTNYTSEKLKTNPAGPGHCVFLESSQIQNLAKSSEKCQEIDKLLKNLKKQYLPVLQQFFSERMAKLELSVYLDLVLRCLLSKPWPSALVPKVTLKVGQYSAEQVLKLGTFWGKYMDHKYPNLEFAVAAGLQSKDAPVDDDSQVGVDLETLRGLKRNLSEPAEGLRSFQEGDEVAVVRRFTWSIGTKAEPDFRKDVNPGTFGIIKGFCDREGRQVLLEVSLKIAGRLQTITKACAPRNLQHKAEYLMQQGENAEAPEPVETPGSSSSGPVLSKAMEFLQMDSQPSEVLVEPRFKPLLADYDSLTQAMCLKSRIGVGLEALHEVLPKYTEKDFLVVHRKDLKGVWKSEVWTKRDFEKHEILLGPWTSQIKEQRFTAAAHAVLGLPPFGRGAHPESLTMALDGRCRSQLASKDMIDPEEHTGSLYWAISRTQDLKKANLEPELFKFQMDLKVSCAGPVAKKLKSQSAVSWDPSELPSFPVLVNKKAILKSTMLCVYLQDRKPDPAAKKEDKDKKPEPAAKENKGKKPEPAAKKGDKGKKAS